MMVHDKRRTKKKQGPAVEQKTDYQKVLRFMINLFRVILIWAIFALGKFW